MSGYSRRYFFPCLLITICLLAVLSVTPAIAAQLGDIPVTEEFAAGMRAVAAMDPDEKIRNPDTMASKFLSPAFWFWTALDEDYDQSKKFIKFYRVNSYYTFNACTKHIDGILQAASENGLQQVVIIGAGLDSRAYRFHKQMPGVRFFEVDLPAAVARKKELVQAAVGKPPATVSYVAVDYRNGPIDHALRQAGYACPISANIQKISMDKKGSLYTNNAARLSWRSTACGARDTWTPACSIAGCSALKRIAAAARVQTGNGPC